MHALFNRAMRNERSERNPITLVRQSAKRLVSEIEGEHASRKRRITLDVCAQGLMLAMGQAQRVVKS
jgi:hypothetical protein